jgi:hypothetical protein
MSTQVETWTEAQWEAAKKRVGQGHNQVGRLPEEMEQTKTRRSKELAIPLNVHDELRLEGFSNSRSTALRDSESEKTPSFEKRQGISA